MMTNEYEQETLEGAAKELAEAIIGDSIVGLNVEKKWGEDVAKIEMKSGRIVELESYGDCCAGASIEEIKRLVNNPNSENVITRVEATEEGTRWHIYAGLDEVMGIEVSAYEGSGYYGYGFYVNVKEA